MINAAILGQALPWVLALVGVGGLTWSIFQYYVLNAPTVRKQLSALSDSDLIAKVEFWQEQAKLVEPLQRRADELLAKLVDCAETGRTASAEIVGLKRRIDVLERGSAAAAAAVAAAATAAADAVTAAAAVAAKAVTAAAHDAVVAADTAAAAAADAAADAAVVAAATTARAAKVAATGAAGNISSE